MKKNNHIGLRILLSCGIGVLSLVIGLCVGIKVSNANPSDSTMDKIVELLKEEWYSDVYYDVEEEDALIAQFVSSIYNINSSKQLDPYTYLYRNATSTKPTFSGKIGITSTRLFGYPVVTKINQGSPAEGILQVHDVVLGMGVEDSNGTVVYHYIEEKDYDFETIFDFAGGEIDEDRYISFARRNEDGTYTVHNEKFTLKASTPTEYTYIEDCPIDDTLMVKLTGFTSLTSSQDTAGQFEKILKDNADSENKKNNLIIDLRDNGGGELSSVVDVCDLFLPEKKLVTTLEMKNGAQSKRYTKDKTAYEFEEIIIMMNENSASASEILIACMDYYFDNVTLVGCTSYGKGIAQKTISVDNNLYLQYTFAKWFSPANVCIQGEGIEPTSQDDTIEKSSSLLTMTRYNNSLYYDTDIFKEDSVSSLNQALAHVLNEKYSYNVRTDGYLDATYTEAIKQYQVAKGLAAKDGKINQDTYLYLLYDFIDERNSLSNQYVNRSKVIIEG